MKTCADLLEMFEGNIATAADQIGVTRQTIYNWQKQRHLPDTAMRMVRDWFLDNKGKVPAEWMPK